MSADLKVVSIQREGWREAAATLRKIADSLDNGELPPCSVGAMVMIHDTKEVGIYGFGPQAEELQTLAAFRLGEQLLIDNILCED